MREADQRGEALGLTEDEVAFYDGLETNDSAVKVLGDATLRDIARELVAAVRANVTIDWTVRENVRACIWRPAPPRQSASGRPADSQSIQTMRLNYPLVRASAAYVAPSLASTPFSP